MEKDFFSIEEVVWFSPTGYQESDAFLAQLP
jgi:hypothetical protein